MSDEEAVLRAEAARQLMQEPVLKQAIEQLESHYITVWKKTGPRDYELREECHMCLYSLHQFVRQLQNYLETGKIIMAASSEPTSVGKS